MRRLFGNSGAGIHGTLKCGPDGSPRRGVIRVDEMPTARVTMTRSQGTDPVAGGLDRKAVARSRKAEAARRAKPQPTAA